MFSSSRASGHPCLQLAAHAGPKPEVVTTDTASYSDMIFGRFALLGYRFSPRFAGLPDQRYRRAPLPDRLPDGPRPAPPLPSVQYTGLRRAFHAVPPDRAPTPLGCRGGKGDVRASEADAQPHVSTPAVRPLGAWVPGIA